MCRAPEVATCALEAPLAFLSWVVISGRVATCDFHLWFHRCRHGARLVARRAHRGS
jgi:hypothetical protein